MGCQRGQGTVEYVGLVALLALVMGAAVTAWSDPTAIGSAVTREMARALCIVSGGLCDADRAPCVTAERRDAKAWHVNAVVFRVGKGQALVREERSDGTVALTLARDRSGGLELGMGADVRAGGVALGLDVRAAWLARRGSGATYVARDRAEADRLQERLLAGRGPLPRPGTRYAEWGADREYELSAATGLTEIGVTHLPSFARGVETDVASGRRTVYVDHASGWEGVLIVGGARGKGARTADERYGIRLDARGRPRELVVLAGGELRGSGDLPTSVAEVAGHLLVPASGGRRWTLETRLDLGDPDVRRAAAGFLQAIRSPRPRIGGPPGPEGELRRLLRERGAAEARTYAVEQSDESLGAHVGTGTRYGGGKDSSRRATRLLAATSRGPGGAWRRRDDCLAA